MGLTSLAYLCAGRTVYLVNQAFEYSIKFLKYSKAVRLIFISHSFP